MIHKKNLVALITGPTSGIGKEISIILAKQGLDLILSSRNKERLNQLKNFITKNFNVKVHVFVTDLSKEDSAKKLVRQIKSKNLTVDVLINNAGVGLMGKSITLPLSSVVSMLMLNIVSLTYLANYFASEMVKKGYGWIMNVGSLVGFFPVPFFSSYSASKAYVLNYSLALREELKNTKVKVSCLVPGYVRTNFDDAAGITDKTYRFFSNFLGMSPEYVAKIGIKNMWQGTPVIIPGFLNQVFSFKIKIFKSLFTFFTGKILRNVCK